MIKEFTFVERRLDQTLGKPGMWMVTNDKEKQRLTIVVRLTRIESQVSKLLEFGCMAWYCVF